MSGFNILAQLQQEKASGLSPEAPTAKRHYTSTFRSRRYPLFTIDPIILHLQGPLSLVEDQGEQALINSALAVAKALPKGKNIATYAKEIEWLTGIGRTILYQDKEQHRAFLQHLMESGLLLKTTQVASRSTLLATIHSYIAERDEWLKENGFTSVEAWQAAELKGGIGALSKEDLAQAMLDL